MWSVFLVNSVVYFQKLILHSLILSSTFGYTPFCNPRKSFRILLVYITCFSLKLEYTVLENLILTPMMTYDPYPVRLILNTDPYSFCGKPQKGQSTTLSH